MPAMQDQRSETRGSLARLVFSATLTAMPLPAVTDTVPQIPLLVALVEPRLARPF